MRKLLHKASKWGAVNAESKNIRVKVLSHLLLARPDEEDDEDGQHDDSQAHDDEREVGDHGGDGQQLMHPCRRCIINHHALYRGSVKNLKPRAFVCY